MKLIATMICALSALASAGVEADAPVFDVPRVDKIKIDGDLADWGDRGFRVEMLTDQDGRTADVKNFDATFRLGWTKRALLLAARVRDDQYVESDNIKELWRGDGLELFLAAKRGSGQLLQGLIAPGMSTPSRLSPARSTQGVQTCCGGPCANTSIRLNFPTDGPSSARG